MFAGVSQVVKAAVVAGALLPETKQKPLTYLAEPSLFSNTSVQGLIPWPVTTLHSALDLPAASTLALYLSPSQQGRAAGISQVDIYVQAHWYDSEVVFYVQCACYDGRWAKPHDKISVVEGVKNRPTYSFFPPLCHLVGHLFPNS